MKISLLFVTAYFIGAIPTAFLAGKVLKNIDIRQHGSGNVGATNAFRVLGKGPGAVVFIIDLLKGVGAVSIFLAFSQNQASSVYALLAGLAAVLGHVFTPFLGFKGGKGVATGAGVLLTTYPTIFFVTIAFWVTSFLITKIVSLSSLIAASALLISGFITTPEPQVRLIFLVMTGFVFWTHRSNIGRLLKGEEQKVVSNKNS